MQNQLALYLIFLTGIILFLAAVLGWEFILGSREENKMIAEISDEEKKKNKVPVISYILHHLFFGFFRSFSFLKFLRRTHKPVAPENPVTSVYYRNKRIFFAILGLLIIILGIIALNSGKFS